MRNFCYPLLGWGGSTGLLESRQASMVESTRSNRKGLHRGFGISGWAHKAAGLLLLFRFPHRISVRCLISFGLQMCSLKFMLKIPLGSYGSQHWEVSRLEGNFWVHQDGSPVMTSVSSWKRPLFCLHRHPLVPLQNYRKHHSSQRSSPPVVPQHDLSAFRLNKLKYCVFFYLFF